MNLKESAKAFLGNDCIGLGYDENIEKQEKDSGVLQGRSLKAHQIPYNMQMDNDLRCLNLALERFLESGTEKDAFDVYFCFIEIFFGGYEKTHTVIELLSEYEQNTSNVVMKHRDHYSHSVYVFALGLAFYRNNRAYRSIYSDFYNISDSKKASYHFLRYWGMTALFHDIGYPFELPFEQVAAYFEAHRYARSTKPYIAYHNLDGYKRVSDELNQKISAALGFDGKSFNTTDEFFASALMLRLGKSYGIAEDNMCNVLENKPAHPEKFNFFMDHAYFSATVLLKKLFEELNLEMSAADVDALSAILLHNSLFKFNIGFCSDKDRGKPLDCNVHPLAYLLMLCDELQCWDRTAYGRNSRNKLYPMDCSVAFSEDGAEVRYIYDNNEKHRANAIGEMLGAAGEKCKFLKDIEEIVNTDIIGLSVSADWDERKQWKKRTYLSDSDFLNLYKFAVALNGRWSMNDDWKKAKEEGTEEEFLKANEESFFDSFNKLSLEYKLSNINQAKSFDRYLNAIGAFYSDRPVDFPELKAFTEKEALIIGPMEHERWLQEHIDMGWSYSTAYSKDERERKRAHPDMIPGEMIKDGLTSEKAKEHYNMLSKATQDKDVEPMNVLLIILRILDGVRIYRL